MTDLSAGTRCSKGLIIIIIDKNLEKSNIKSIESKERFIMSEIKVEDRIMVVANAYTPCDDRGTIYCLTELSIAVYKNMNK